MTQLFKLLISILIVLSFTSCSLSFLKEQRTCYKDLRHFISKNWVYSNSDSTVTVNRILEREAMSNSGSIQSCIVGLSEKQVTTLFGKPHDTGMQAGNCIKGNRFYYFTNIECHPLNESKYCNYYYFQFNLAGKCTQMGIGVLSTEY